VSEKTRRITKEDWYLIGCALREQSELLMKWASNHDYSEAMRQGFMDTMDANLDLLAYVVNTKMSDKDRYGFFTEFVDW